MAQSHNRGIWVWAASCVLLAGCATSRQAGDSVEVDGKLVEAHAHYAQALIHEMNDESDLALEEFSKAAVADPANEQLVVDLTRRYLQAKEPEKALDLLLKAAASPKASGTVFAHLGLVYSRMGKDAEAVKATQTAIKRAPKSLAGYQNLSIIHMQAARFKEALQVMDQAAKVPDTSVEFLADLAGLYTNLERQAPSLKASTTAGGLAVLQRAAKLEPTNPRLSLRLADGFNALGATAEASKIYLHLLEKYGELPLLRNDVHAKLADIYLRGDDFVKAKDQLEAIVREDPANAQAYYFLGRLASDETKLPEAIGYFQKSLLLDDEFEQAYYDLAGAQINFDKPKEGLATLDKARAKFARSFTGEFLAAVASVRSKDFTNAVSHFTAAESLARAEEPAKLNAYFYFEAGAAYERKGDFEHAEEYFQKSLELSPEMAEALNYYGYMLADRGQKLPQAREMIDKAVKLEPNNPAYIDSLGWVLFKLGKAEEALPQIQKAIELSPGQDATLFEHLGDIYSMLKQPDKAREAWRKSLSVEPNEQIQKKLDQSGGK